jgi:anti-anti-sigma factor
MEFIKSAGEKAVITLKGKLDYATAGNLMDELRTLEGTGVRQIDFECADLEYISSAGIRAMLYSKQKIGRNAPVDVCLHQASKTIQDVFAATGLKDYFTFVE